MVKLNVQVALHVNLCHHAFIQFQNNSLIYHLTLCDISVVLMTAKKYTSTRHTLLLRIKFRHNISPLIPLTEPLLRWFYFAAAAFALFCCSSSSGAWQNSATYRHLSITFGIGLISVPNSCSIRWRANLSS